LILRLLEVKEYIVAGLFMGEKYRAFHNVLCDGMV
jgi:hypothetical protein